MCGTTVASSGSNTMSTDRKVETTDSPRLLRHPLSAVFPTYLGSDRYRELVRSIRYNGVLNPITLYDGMIVDGWHRYQAALQADVEVPTVPYTGDAVGLLNLVVANNVVRRELSQSQLGLAAARVIRDGDGTGSRPDARGVQLLFGVGETVVCESNRVLRHGSDGLVHLVERGALPVKVAARAAVSLTKAEQEKLAAQGPAAVKREVARLRRAVGAGKAAKTVPAPAAVPEHNRHQLSRTNPLLNEVLNALALVRERVPLLLDTPEGKKLGRYVKALGLPWLDDPDLGFSACHRVWLLLAATAQERELSLDDMRWLMRP